MKSYIEKGIILTAVCLFPFAALAKTTIVQEYNFDISEQICKGPGCNTNNVSPCPGYPYTCSKTGLKGKGKSCYDSGNKKTTYKECECAAGWIKSSEVILNNGNGSYYAGENTGGSGGNVGSTEPVSEGGATCYKREYIHCPVNRPQYEGNTLPDPSVIRTPVTTVALGSNTCVEYNFLPLLSSFHKNDNILCLDGYTCNSDIGCYTTASQAVSHSTTNCFETGVVYGDMLVNGQRPVCRQVQGCKTSGECGSSKPSGGFTYTEETLNNITCYKATGCINRWLVTDTSNSAAYQAMYTTTATYPSVSGSHTSSNISSMGRECKRWTGCNSVDGWEEYARGVGSSQQETAAAMAAHQNNITYEVSVLSVGTGENMNYFICRRPITVICPTGTYNDECSADNSCSWIKFFLPE